MHALTAIVLTLAGSAIAAPAKRSTEQENFTLITANQPNLVGWAVLEAHIAAGQNVIEIQRPSAFQSEKVHLFGTTKEVNNNEAQLFSHKAAGSKYSWVLPTPAAGQIGQVFSELGDETDNWGTTGNTNAKLRLTANGSPHGFYACPTNVPGDGKVFTLWYGQGSVSFGGKKCQGIELEVVF